MRRQEVVDHDDDVTRFEHRPIRFEIHGGRPFHHGADHSPLQRRRREGEDELPVRPRGRLQPNAVAGGRWIAGREVAEPHRYLIEFPCTGRADQLAGQGPVVTFSRCHGPNSSPPALADERATSYHRIVNQPPDADPTAGPDPAEPMTESMRQVMSLAGDVDKLTSFYADWASYYDSDVAEHGYGLPAMMLAAVNAAAGHDEAAGRYLDRSVPVLDAGCGTGLVGVVMHDAGYHDLHGIDLSHEMVERARERDIYRSLEGGIDLSRPVPDHLVRSAQIVLVGGVFTVGHIPPEALSVVAALPSTGGLLVVSTRQSYQESTDFVAVQQAMVEAGDLQLLAHLPDAPYTMDSTGDYWAWRIPS